MGALAICAIAWSASTHALGDDDFPIAGLYAKDQACKGDGSDPADILVKITRANIESNMGYCAILSSRRQGRTVSVQVQCKMPGDQVILGDASFTIRDDKALDFDDQDHTSPAVLYRCTR